MSFYSGPTPANFMSYETRQFENGEIYHITIRRIGDELLFKDIDDYYRGIFSIYEFNTTEPVTIREQRRIRAQIKKAEEIGRGRTAVIDKRDKLVEVLAFCFMPNHIHLLLKQLRDGGISKFMQKFGSGYSSYFKEKYNERGKGHFFQKRFSFVHIETEEQLKTVFVYIHTNPLALIDSNWKEKGIKNPERAIKFLNEEYRWSSYFDYIGKKNFPSVTEREFILEVMGGEQNCKKFVEEWIRYKGEIKKFADLALEED